MNGDVTHTATGTPAATPPGPSGVSGLPGAQVRSDASAAPSGPSAHSARPVPSAAGVPRPVTGLSVVDAWSRLLAYLIVVTVASVAIVMPVVGTTLALAGAVVLRAGDQARRSTARGARWWPLRLLWAVAGTALTLPYAAAIGAAVAVGLVVPAAVGVAVDPLPAGAWGVGAGVFVLWAGPGVRAPRRALTALVAAVAPSHRLIGLAGVVLGTAAFLAIIGAVTFRPSFAPMYGLHNSVQITLGHLQSVIETRVGLEPATVHRHGSGRTVVGSGL